MANGARRGHEDLQTSKALATQLTIPSQFLRGYGSVILAILLWESFSRSGLVDPLFLPSLSQVAAALFQESVNGVILWNLLLSLGRASAGLLIAAGAGIGIGLLTGLRRRWDEFFDPLISVLYPVPSVVWIPLAILWLGLGNKTIILIIFIACTFPMIITTYFGVKGVSEYLVWSARSMGLKPRGVIRKVILRGSLPNIFTGLRIILHISLLLAVATEMVMGGDGIGFFIIEAQLLFRIKEMFAGILTISLTGLFLDKTLLFARHRLLAWEEG